MTSPSEALHCLSPNSKRDVWVKDLMAFHAETGEAGKEIAKAWSSQGDSYNPRDFESTWRSLKPEGGIGPGTLYYRAQQHGGAPVKRSNSHPLPPAKTSAKAISKTFEYAKTLWQKNQPGEFESADERVASHPYAKIKGINWAAGAVRGNCSGTVIGRNADCLVIALRGYPSLKFCGVECINPEGKKQTFGRKGVLLLGNSLDDSLPQIVCEGWATSVEHLRLFDANVAVYCCGGKGQLRRLAEAVHKHTGRRIIIRSEIDG